MELSLQTIIFALANFMILLLMLRKFLYRPVQNMLLERSQAIAQSRQNIANSQAQIASIEKEAKRKLVAAQAEVESIITAAKDSADKMKARILEQANQDAHKIITNANALIEKERQEAEQILRKRIASLAIMVAQRILTEESTPELQKRMLEKHLAKIEGEAASEGEVIPLPNNILAHQNNNLLQVGVITALPLAAEDEKALKTVLQDCFGQQIALAKEIDPDIIGGTILKIGEKHYDYSFKNRLANFEKKLLA